MFKYNKIIKLTNNYKRFFYLSNVTIIDNIEKAKECVNTV